MENRRQKVMLMEVEKLTYKPLNLDNGRIGHLDFVRVHDSKTLKQMISNAIITMESHAQKGRYGQATAFAMSIEGGFKHAKCMPWEEYSTLDFNGLGDYFKELVNKYKIPASFSKSVYIWELGR